MRHFTALFLLLAGAPCYAETVVAAHTIRPQTILAAQDLAVSSAQTVGAFSDVDDLIGLETRTALYAGRPIRPGDVGPPAIVDRNQIVLLTYIAGGLTITTEARALGRGGVGDVIRVLNISSRMTLEGRIGPDGSVLVR